MELTAWHGYVRACQSFLRPLVNEQDDQVGVRVILQNGIGKLLRTVCLSRRPRSGHGAFADGADDIQHARDIPRDRSPIETVPRGARA